MSERGMMRMPSWMMSGHAMEGMGRDMSVIHGLLMNHARIQRSVEDIPGGVRTVTTSEDPEVAELIRAHVWRMKERMEQGEPIRQMDPLFRELFRRRAQIRIEVQDTPRGVIVTETSADPQVVLLIRQHAHRAVSEFVERGMARAMEPTPLPEGYRAQVLRRDGAERRCCGERPG